jgi:hypothetical protein
MSCRLLSEHAAQGKIAFGINHEMSDFRNNRKKDLDLVVCTPADPPTKTGISFEGYAREKLVRFDGEDERLLKKLPNLKRAPVGSVLLALEAKACMTAHQKALPRLYDELNSSHQTVHGALNQAIAAGFVMINAADKFLSPERNSRPEAERLWNIHRQMRDATMTVQKIEQIPRRTNVGEAGYDALGIAVVICRNDGSTVQLVNGPPAPAQGDIFHYDRFIERIGQLYASRFASL